MNEIYKETHFYDVKGDRLKIGAHKSGGYGDMADYIVLLNSIKEKHPGCYLVAYIGKFPDEGGKTEQLLKFFPDIVDRVVVVDFGDIKDSFFNEGYVIDFAKNFDYFYDLRPYVGKVYSGDDSVITLEVPFKLPKEWEWDMQWVDFYRKPLSQYQNVLLDHFPDKSHLEITADSCGLPTPDWSSVEPTLRRKKLDLTFLDEKWITVSVSSGGANRGIVQTKTWDFDQWIALCDSIKNTGINIIQIGLTGEPQLRNVDYFWDRSIPEVLTLLEQSPLHLSVENGTARMRALVTDKPMITLFGPTDPTFFGLPNQNRVHTNKCRPCFWLIPSWFTDCHRASNPETIEDNYGIDSSYEKVCMKSITPEIVYNTTMDEVEKLGWDLSKRELVTGFSFLSKQYFTNFSNNTKKQIGQSVHDQSKYETGTFDLDYSARTFFFNPAVTKTEDKTILWTRKYDVLPRSVKHREAQLANNSIEPYTLNDDMTVGDKIPYNLVGQYPGEQMEDPRAMYYNGKYYIGCASYVPAEFPFSGSTHQKLYILDDSGRYEDYLSINYEGNADNILDTSRSQKNWSWFFKDDRLHIVYDMHPRHTVLICDSEMKYPEKRFISNRAYWKYGESRGGSNPILHEGRYWCFFHSSTDVAPGKRIYFMGYYSFSPEPPFNVLSVSKEPILSGNYIDNGNPYIRSLVVFPGGAYLEDDTWTVVYGVNDYSSGWIKIPHKDLK